MHTHTTARQLTRVELDEVLDLARCNVHLHNIVDLDKGIWVADCAAIVGGEHRYALGRHRQRAYAAQLVLLQRQDNTV